MSSNRIGVAGPAGFLVKADPRAARRQLLVSVGVVLVLAAASVMSVLAFAPRWERNQGAAYAGGVHQVTLKVGLQGSAPARG